jgi:hypothetical protein
MYYDDLLYGCAFGCPLLMRDQNCPFNEVDHLSIREKVIWIQSLELETKQMIADHHLFCSKKKEIKQTLRLFHV